VTRRDVAALTVGVVAVTVATAYWFVQLGEAGLLSVDWATYANAFARWRDGLAVFDAVQTSGPYELPDVVRFGYAYPPPTVPFFAPFATFPVGFFLWETANVAVLMTGLYAVMRHEIPDHSAMGFAVAMGALALFAGYGIGIAAGNVNVGLAGILAWAWVLGRGHRAGIIAGAGAILKVVPGVLVFWTRPSSFSWTVAWAVVTAGTLSLITLPFVGFQSWLDFAIALGNSMPICDAVGFHPSLACGAIELGIPITAAKLFSIVAAGALGLGALWVTNDFIAFALVVFAMLAPVADMHAHSLLPLFVLAVVGVARTAGMRTRRSHSLR